MDDLRKLKRKRRIFRGLSFGLPVVIIFLLLAELGSHSIRTEGLSTVATVTFVEWRQTENDAADEGHFRTTFEYYVDSQRISSSRTGSTTRQSHNPPWRVGQEVRIYYSSRPPHNFVFADGESFSVAYWIFIGGMVVGWAFVLQKNRQVKNQMKGLIQGNGDFSNI